MALCVQLPSWAGLRPQQNSAAFFHLPIADFKPSHASPLQIRMGGGPRTFPGGVSKWQWKKMQQKKAKQMLKARLLRERQLYEMRKRAELKAAMAATNELEKPWEKTAPTLFSVTADDQLQSMADRFVKPGAVDLWTENDGPNQFLQAPDGKPSVRVFPKDALHSTKPYARVFHSSTDSGDARSARSETSHARSARSETSSEQATEYSHPARESSNSDQRDINRISRPNTVGFRRQDGKLRTNFQYSEKTERYKLGRGIDGSISRPGSGVQGFRSQDGKLRGNFRFSEKSERYKLGKGNEGSISRPGSGVQGFKRQDGKLRGNFQYSERSERYTLGKGNEGSISRPGSGVQGFRRQDGKLRGNFQYSKRSERYTLGKGNEGSISRPGSGVQGFRSQDGKFRGNFQFSEKSERYKLGKGDEGSISRPGSGVKGSGVGLKKGVGRIRRLYSEGADYGSRKFNGYLQMDGVQSFAGFDLAKVSRQKGRAGELSNEDDYDYGNGSERKSFF